MPEARVSSAPAAPPAPIERASAWIYSGLWAGLTRLFLVPREAPSMPAGAHEIIGAYRPAPGYLRYTKFFFWLALFPPDVGVSIIWLVIFVRFPIAGLILAPFALAIIILPDIVAYIAIHLRYDTTWYVLTDRSLRLRRGVLLLNEITITYENVQNVTVEQGPVQRHFGIADVVVQTAGGSSGGGGGKHGSTENSHTGRIQGVDNAHQIRDLIMTRVRASRSAGLGDEHHAHDQSHSSASASTPSWTPSHLATLRQIRDLLPTRS